MANTIAEAFGHDRTAFPYKVKETHRLGSEMAETRAATQNTEALAWVKKDGTVRIIVRRNDQIIHEYELTEPEQARETPVSAGVSGNSGRAE